MTKEQCLKFDTCSAALCPLDPNPRHYWYSDTEVCTRRDIKTAWILTQRKIAKINPDPHSHYTIKMLQSIKTIRRDITGLNCVGYHQQLESEWISRRQDRHNSDDIASVAS